MTSSDRFRRGRSVVSALNVHLVFIPKYRRRVISQKVFVLLREAWETVCRDFGAELVEASFEPDHVHLLVAYPPKVAIAVLVNSLKGVSARRLRAAALPEIEATFFGRHFWSPSYCAVSCGGAPLDRVAEYVRNQKQGGPVSSRR